MFTLTIFLFFMNPAILLLISRDVFCRKSICVENRVNNDSVIRAVAHREYSDSEVVKYLGGVLGVGIERLPPT